MDYSILLLQQSGKKSDKNGEGSNGTSKNGTEGISNSEDPDSPGKEEYRQRLRNALFHNISGHKQRGVLSFKTVTPAKHSSKTISECIV